ncbi:MAG TPA: NAD-dependent dehydratase [Pusillimonas sp.]|nr:NAD-dependent dehydratase [Pusillimonas sp.]
MNILITGATGMVGHALYSHLKSSGHDVVGTTRGNHNSDMVAVDELHSATDWNPVLNKPFDACVHLAARVHVMSDKTNNAEEAYQSTNTAGTLQLAQQCATHGVKRFIFISTVKVMGEGRPEPYQATDPAQPQDPYSRSKWMAEQGLWEISKETGMEVVILRPPLVYGPNMKGNLLSLFRLIERGVPLPFGAIRNSRSLIYTGNLIGAIEACLVHPKAVGQIFLVSDNEDTSTPELIRKIARALEKRCHLLPIPSQLFSWAGKILGREAMVNRLTGSLSVNTQPIRNVLNWTPPYTAEEGLRLTAKWYRSIR